MHAFLCVVGLLFYRRILRRADDAPGERVSIEALAARLGWIQVLTLRQKGSKRVKVVPQKLSPEQKGVVDSLQPAPYVPNDPGHRTPLLR